MSTLGTEPVRAEIEQLYRRQAGQIISTLTRFFGADHIDLAESVVHEALTRAIQTWPVEGMPANPAGWITQAAKNIAIDIARRERSFREKEPEIIQWVEHESARAEPGDEVVYENELKDDQLKMIFTCCHPTLSRNSQVALTLKTLCGFTVGEIARAFLTREETIAQRLVRAKAKIRDEKLPFEVPAPAEIAPRLTPVLDVIYLMFNEGYSASEGPELTRQELCAEAIRLATLLAAHPVGNVPRVQALLSLMLLQSSRLAARCDVDGNIILLEDQDRSLWDRRLIEQGISHLELAMEGSEISEYHLQAGIAAAHAMAPDFQSTPWEKILFFYDQLMSMHPSPVAALNRAVALSMLVGPEAGLQELDRLMAGNQLGDYHLLPATYGDFHRRLGNTEEARACFSEAWELAKTEPERRFLARRLRELGASTLS